MGDSITHGGGYMRNITLFYATRYPEDFLNFYNLGISGDTVKHVNKRMKSDIPCAQTRRRNAHELA